MHALNAEMSATYWKTVFEDESVSTICFGSEIRIRKTKKSSCLDVLSSDPQTAQLAQQIRTWRAKGPKMAGDSPSEASMCSSGVWVCEFIRPNLYLAEPEKP